MSTDLMPIQGYDYIEYYVGNARQAAYYYGKAFGFSVVAYAGPETRVRDRVSYVIEQGDVRWVLTAATRAESDIARHQYFHGDGIKDVAFTVPDAEEAFRVAVDRGAKPAQEPQVMEDEHGKIVRASIAAYGETIHTFVDRANYSGPFAPGFETSDDWNRNEGTGLSHIDHVVCNVDLGKMDTWARYYAVIMGFTQLHHFDDEAISTEYSALMSKVLWDGEGRIKLPINEPAEGKKTSQIEEYLDFYKGPGVQHIAIATDDIVATVAELQNRDVKFLGVPDEYYVDLKDRLDWSTIDADIDRLASLGILVDQDDEGYLLQIFSSPMQDRPTIFYEVIERHGSRGFGVGNFQALFQAIEREQEARGNL